MDIGTKIKEYRSINGLTQKDLAEHLHVTYQAVSKWENNDAEPSFDCLVEMTKIFHCSMDDLFGFEKEQAAEPEERIVEKFVVKDAPKIVAICDECKKVIYEGDEAIHAERTSPGGEKQKIVLCKDCHEKRKEEEDRGKREKKKREKADLLTRRKRAFGWGTVVALAGIAVAVFMFVRGNVTVGGVVLGAAVLAFTFLGCVFLDNNFIPDMWLEIASWGFVRMPGVIMEFSLGGLLIGIALKILLWILGIMIAVVVMIGATVLGMTLSLFVYPFALRKNIKETDNDPKEIKQEA